MNGILQQAGQWVSGKLPWQHSAPDGNAMANPGGYGTQPGNGSSPYGSGFPPNRVPPNYPQNYPLGGPANRMAMGNPYSPRNYSPQNPQQAALTKGGPRLVQPLPRDVMEKRLPVKALPKRPKISLTPDQIRNNPILAKTMQFEQEFISMPWDFSNHIDPFNKH